MKILVSRTRSPGVASLARVLNVFTGFNGFSSSFLFFLMQLLFRMLSISKLFRNNASMKAEVWLNMFHMLNKIEHFPQQGGVDEVNNMDSSMGMKQCDSEHFQQVPYSCHSDVMLVPWHLSYSIWHPCLCAHMTWHTPARDMFGFKMTSRQREARQAGRLSVWKKRSSRKRPSSLLSSDWQSAPPPPAPPTPIASTPLRQLQDSLLLFCPPQLRLFLLYFVHPVRTHQHLQSCEEIMRTPCQVWLVSSVHLDLPPPISPPFFSFLDVPLSAFSNVGEGVLSFRRRGCFLFLFLLLFCFCFFSPPAAGGKWKTFVTAKFEGTSPSLPLTCPPAGACPSWSPTTTTPYTPPPPQTHR